MSICKWLNKWFKKPTPAPSAPPQADPRDDKEPEKPAPRPKPRPEIMLYSPTVDKIDHRMERQRYFSDGKPRFICVHFSGGRKDNLNGFVEWLTYKKWGVHMAIAYNGETWQTLPYDQWGAHIGRSMWNGTKNLNWYSLGFEPLCAGKLIKHGNKYYPYWEENRWKKPIPENEIRFIDKNKGTHRKGAWHKFSPIQEEILIREIVFAAAMFNIPASDVFGHQEVGYDKYYKTLGRKPDPGACLSMTMGEFREVIAAELKKFS